jgi:hypothetical protein
MWVGFLPSGTAWISDFQLCKDICCFMLAAQRTGLCLHMMITVICALVAFLVHITVTTSVRIELHYTAAGDNFSLSQYLLPVFLTCLLNLCQLSFVTSDTESLVTCCHFEGLYPL